MLPDPVRRAHQALGQQPDVEVKMRGAFIHRLLLGGEQVEEQRGEARLLEDSGDEAVAG